MDEFTRKHLAAWLYREIVNEDQREAVRVAMTARFNDDPEYWKTHGWPELFIAVSGYSIGGKL
jgi:hypothetical protein